ncbi:MAG TPA: hypothetical protein VIX90_06150 [Edaphobacter sp.]
MGEIVMGGRNMLMVGFVYSNTVGRARRDRKVWYSRGYHHPLPGVR